MFNKTIVVALLVCACYLGTIEARPGLTDLAAAGILGATAGQFAAAALPLGGLGGVGDIGGLGQTPILAQLPKLPGGGITG